MTESIEETFGWEPTADVIAAEEQVLGAALATSIADELRVDADDFYRPSHRKVWTAIRALTDRGDPVDPASVVREMQGDSPREVTEAHALVYRLYSGLVTGVNAGYHADTVVEASRLRRLYEAGVHIQQISSTSGDVDDKLDRARERLAAVESKATTATARPVSDLLAETLDRVEAGSVPGLPTGLADLDETLGPMLPGQLLLVGARPGVGKSSLLLTIARNVAQTVADDNGEVVLCSLEMSGDEVSKRLLASTGVELGALMRNALDDLQWQRVAKGLGVVSDLPLFVDDSETVSLTDLRVLCRRHPRARLLVLDYAQLMQAPKAESRQTEVAALSRGLKLLAKAVGIPLLVACQLNREPESRGDHRPRLSDLRESGAWEMDADVVALLHRDPEQPGEMEVIVAKQRNGPTTTVNVGWQGPYSRVVNLTERWMREGRPA